MPKDSDPGDPNRDSRMKAPARAGKTDIPDQSRSCSEEGALRPSPPDRQVKGGELNQAGRSRALVVGICEYSVASSLDFSVSDAKEIADILMFPEYDFAVTTLFDEQATRAALLVALHELVESDADNLFLLFRTRSFGRVRSIPLHCGRCPKRSRARPSLPCTPCASPSTNRANNYHYPRLLSCWRDDVRYREWCDAFAAAT